MKLHRLSNNMLLYMLFIGFIFTISCSQSPHNCCNPPSEIDLFECGPMHQMAEYHTSWQYIDCFSNAGIYISKDSLDVFTGEPLGDRKVNRGMFTLRVSNLLNTQFDRKAAYAWHFFAKDSFNVDSSWHWISIGAENNRVKSFLVSNYQDGACLTKLSCERYASSDVPQFFDIYDSWQWGCEWNIDDHIIKCDISKPSDSVFGITTVQTTILGDFNALRYLSVGNSASDGSYIGYNGTIEMFKITFFD